jgi:hypothetical protein
MQRRGFLQALIACLPAVSLAKRGGCGPTGPKPHVAKDLSYSVFDENLRSFRLGVSDSEVEDEAVPWPSLSWP